ncbi:type IV pilus biogenesis protein PilM [Alkalicoccobacillus porphyridii]|nr:pilus assembly protein PilM [Alkalicoccobacillus porphyridii]
MGILGGRKQQRHALVLKDHVIRYVGSKRADLSSIQSFGELYLPPGLIHRGKIEDKEEVKRLIEREQDAWELKKKNPVQLCVPDSQMLIRRHEVAANVPDEELKGQLYIDAGDSLVLPFEDPIFDYQKLREDEEKKELLLYITKESVMNDYVKLIDQLGFQANAADLTSACAYRLFHEQHLLEEHPFTVLVQYDVSLVIITILAAGQPLFSRTWPLAYDEERWDIRDGQLEWKLDVETVTAEIQMISAEVEKVISFYQYSVLRGEMDIARMLICGDTIAMDLVVSEFKDFFSMNIVSQLEFTDSYVPARYYDALGLMLRKEVR